MLWFYINRSFATHSFNTQGDHHEYREFCPAENHQKVSQAHATKDLSRIQCRSTPIQGLEGNQGQADRRWTPGSPEQGPYQGSIKNLS